MWEMGDVCVLLFLVACCPQVLGGEVGWALSVIMRFCHIGEVTRGEDSVFIADSCPLSLLAPSQLPEFQGTHS